MRQKVSEVIPSWKGSVIDYSAKKRYKLPQFFSAMLDAVPQERQWVLASRKALANYYDLVDTRFLPESKRQKQKKKLLKSKPIVVSQSINDLSEEEFQLIATTKDGFIEWLKKQNI